jgi:hypothetical protein
VRWSAPGLFVVHRGRAGPVAAVTPPSLRTAYVHEQLSMAAPRGIGFADEAEKASDNIVSGITGVYPCLLPGPAFLAADVVSALGSVCPFQPASKLAAAIGRELTLFSHATSLASASLCLYFCFVSPVQGNYEKSLENSAAATKDMSRTTNSDYRCPLPPP